MSAGPDRDPNRQDAPSPGWPRWRTRLEALDASVIGWMQRHGLTLLRWSLGLVFLWFGALKFVPDASPAADLALRTIDQLTGGALAPRQALGVLAAWECLIGLGLLAGRLLRLTLALLWLQMLGAVLPVFLFPEAVFRQIPLVPTLEGQYIVKNAVLISASLVLGADLRRS